LELNNEIISLNFAERREVERLLKEITNLIGKESEKLRASLNAVAYIDSVFARAKHSIEIIGSFPTIDEKKPFNLTDARHPVLQKKLGKKDTVPLNVNLSGEKIIILTGPNAGGKTVVLKTIGLLSLLLQSGIHIPASADSNIHIFENILIDIGDEQSIEDDLSTFTSHLSNIRNILESADKNTLVLLDEIGTGTDPAEGSALATATLLKLRDLGALVFASTHHGNLKLIAQDEYGFANAAMEFDHEKLTPTYKFKMGVPGSSYAFEIAKRIGISEELLRSASENMETDKYKIEQFLVDIEAKSTRLEKKLKELELENIRLSGLSNLYKKNVEKLEKEKKEILKKAKSDADLYLVDVNKNIEKVIKDLRESKAAREVIKNSKKIVEEIKQKNENLFTPEVEIEPRITDFNVGGFVSLKNTSTAGRIIELDKVKKRATIQVGTIKMKVHIDEILPAKEGKKSEPLKSYHNYKIPKTEYRLDIRGKKPEEADFEIVTFIDNSFMAGESRIEILHGKGTGALKRAVNEILKKHDNVKDFYFAPIESGGEGITIVELK
jgi:DNA mismatch repair protein MutS2